jgi:hypothetical protein
MRVVVFSCTVVTVYIGLLTFRTDMCWIRACAMVTEMGGFDFANEEHNDIVNRGNCTITQQKELAARDSVTMQ